MKDCNYVVIDENTLGYYFKHSPNTLGILSSNKNGFNPKCGYIFPIQSINIRKANKNDFENFRVELPPDFKE